MTPSWLNYATSWEGSFLVSQEGSQVPSQEVSFLPGFLGNLFTFSSHCGTAGVMDKAMANFSNPQDPFVVRHRNPTARDWVVVSRVVLLGYHQVSDGAKLTYWVIYSHDWYEPDRGGRKGYVYPTVGRLAQLRHSAVRTIQRHIAELISAGLLTRLERPGKASILYIEEPSDQEVSQYLQERHHGGDNSVGGVVTFLSPQQEEKEKQEKSVNGDRQNFMEEGRGSSNGWQPIRHLLASRVRPTATGNRTSWIASQLVEATEDQQSLGCYRTLAARCPAELLFEAVALLKEARDDGAIRRSSGALFVSIVRRLCHERGLPDPLGKVGGDDHALGREGGRLAASVEHPR